MEPQYRVASNAFMPKRWIVLFRIGFAVGLAAFSIGELINLGYHIYHHGLGTHLQDVLSRGWYIISLVWLPLALANIYVNIQFLMQHSESAFKKATRINLWLLYVLPLCVVELLL